MTNAYAAVAPTSPLPTTPVFIQAPVSAGTQDNKQLFQPFYAILFGYLVIDSCFGHRQFVCDAEKFNVLPEPGGITNTDFILTSYADQSILDRLLAHASISTL